MICADETTVGATLNCPPPTQKKIKKSQAESNKLRSSVC